MPAQTAPTLPEVRHEDFCRPTGDRTQVRMEQFPAYADDLQTGRSRPKHLVTRCVECGASHYQLIGAING